MKKRLAIIPARSGSKRIPDKNIKHFHGRPMISYSIEAAIKSGLFDKIHVSTDSERIADIARELGAEAPFKRPDNLCDDITPIMPVLKYVVEEYMRREETFDTISTLFATTPMLSIPDLQKACAEFERGDQSKVMMSVTPLPVPIEWSFRMQENDGNMIPVFPNGFAKRSQDLQEAYYDAAMFYFYNPAYILNSTGAGNDSDFKGFPVEGRRVVDIDTPEQWALAETLYKAINGI